MLSGRQYVTPDDVKFLAVPVLAHRMMTKAWDQGGRNDTEAIVNEIVAKTKVPV